MSHDDYEGKYKETFYTTGLRIARNLTGEIRRNDITRAVTEAFNDFAARRGLSGRWDSIPGHIALLDVASDKIAGVGSGDPRDMSSLQQPRKKSYQGICLAIIRPETTPGKIRLRATAEGLKDASVVIIAR